MSKKTFTFTECLIVIASVGYRQSINREQTDQAPAEKKVSEFGPPRNEKGSDSIKRLDYTLEDLLAQMWEDDTDSNKAKAAPFGPPRAEKGSYPLKHPDYTLKDLLDQMKESSSHDEIDTDPPVGNEVW
ncbi:MAG: hypothetical protein OYL97_16580 [Candidatus Poribacteria bacterium]|nr:hypothetical protein [Candidatus Poribacteria bacterium]